jgi:3-oxoacyl-[acyl-carrier protein] reductase
VVTGAGRGIGRAIAVAYAEAGAAVCCTARTIEEIDDTVSEIGRLGGRGLAVQADVTQISSVHNIFSTAVAHLGGVDILVINAGARPPRKHVEDSDPEEWKATLDVNLLGAYYCARTAIPYLKERGAGKIILVGSGNGHRAGPGRSAYACSKAGLWMLTRVLAQELQPHRISVNELIPGPTDTALASDLVANRDASPVLQQEWLKTPEDVVPLALFLATQPAVGPTAQSFSLMRRDN